MTVRLVFAGSGPFALPVLEALADSDLDITLVITRPDSRSGRGRRVTEQDVATMADGLGLPVAKPGNINDGAFLEELSATGSDLMLTASFGQFFGKRLRELFPHGCWNLHPSALPLYRGAAPVPAALRDGLDETAVTLFRMVREMDAGPIAAGVPVPIDREDDAGSLLDRCARAAGTLAVESLPAIVGGRLELIDQDPEKATLSAKMTKDSGRLDWSRPATEIVNLARSVTPWPGAWTTLDGIKLGLKELAEVDGPEGDPGELTEVGRDRIVIACGSGAVAPSTWQLAGKKPLTTRDFLNGRHLTAGTRLESDPGT